MSFDVQRTTLSGNNCYRRRKKLNIDIEEVYRMIDKEHLSIARLCEIYHCCRETLQKYHRLYQADNPKIKRRYLTGNSINRYSQYKYINIERVLEEIDAGKTIAQVCKEKNVSRTTLRRKFLEYREEKMKELKETTEQ